MDSHLLRFDKDKTFVFIDFETENLCLNFRQNMPWQMAMIKVRGDSKFDERDIMIKWDRELRVSPEAARITRFSDEKYKSLRKPHEKVFPLMEKWLEEADYIVGHNILGFDIYLILEFYKKMGKNGAHLVDKMIDTFCLSKAYKLGSQKPSEASLIEFQYRCLDIRKKRLGCSLQAIARNFDIEHNYDKLHDALVDLDLNLKVWNKLKWQLEV
jgi:DNA polymerase III epsilon subunit-like protein|tara:strand:+ start:1500 stop:2138 length:639 start_codon:yes stop_codon:yes gene_type:complete